MEEKQKRKEKRIIKIESKHKKKDNKYITEKDHIRIEGADTSRLKP